MHKLILTQRRHEPKNKSPAKSAWPVVNELIHIIDSVERLPYRPICERAGVHYQIFHRMKHGVNSPNVATISALGEAIGYKLTWEKL